MSLTLLLILHLLVQIALWAWLISGIYIFFRESALAEKGLSDLIKKGAPLPKQLIVAALCPLFYVFWFADELIRRWRLCPKLEAELRPWALDRK